MGRARQHQDRELRRSAATPTCRRAGLIQDLKRRGLLDETIVLWTGEFGRLPVSQNGTGRDHNRNAFSLSWPAAASRRGYVHGATDDVGYKAAVNRVSVPDLHATILHQLGLDHEAAHLRAPRPRRNADRRPGHRGAGRPRSAELVFSVAPGKGVGSQLRQRLSKWKTLTAIDSRPRHARIFVSTFPATSVRR